MSLDLSCYFLSQIPKSPTEQDQGQVGHRETETVQKGNGRLLLFPVALWEVRNIPNLNSGPLTCAIQAAEGNSEYTIFY